MDKYKYVPKNKKELEASETWGILPTTLKTIGGDKKNLGLQSHAGAPLMCMPPLIGLSLLN